MRLLLILLSVLLATPVWAANGLCLYEGVSGAERLKCIQARDAETCTRLPGCHWRTTDAGHHERQCEGCMTVRPINPAVCRDHHDRQSCEANSNCKWGAIPCPQSMCGGCEARLMGGYGGCGNYTDRHNCENDNRCHYVARPCR